MSQSISHSLPSLRTDLHTMGKAKKEKARLRQARAKADPTGLAAASAALITATAEAVTSPAKRQQLIETLTSGTANQKAIACHAIAHMISNTASSAASSPFLHPQLLSRLLGLLFTADFDTRLAASIALHSLTSLSHRACTALLKLDLLPACLSLLPASTPSMAALTVSQRCSLLVQVVGCIRDVTEQVDSALAELSSSPPAVQSLLALFCDSRDGSEEMRCEVGGLLLAMTEDNEQLRAVINSVPSSASTFVSLLADSTASPLLLRCQLAGVVLNLQSPQQLAVLAVRGESGGTQNVTAVVQEAVQAALTVLHSALQVDVAGISRDMLGAMRVERERLNERLTQLDHAKQPAGEVREVSMQTDDSKQADMADIDTDEQKQQTTSHITDRTSHAAHKKEPTANDVEKESQRATELLIARWHTQLQCTRLGLELLSNLCAEDEDAGIDDDGDERAVDEHKVDSDASSQLTWVGERLIAADTFAAVMRLLAVRVSGESESQDERSVVASMVGEDYAEECCSAVASLRCRAAALLTNLILYLPVASFASHIPALLHYSGQRLTQLLSPASPPPPATTANTVISASSASSQLDESAVSEVESLTGLYYVISKLSHSATSATSATSPSSATSPLLEPQHAQTLLTVLTQPATPLPVQLNVIDILSLLATHAPQPSLPSSAFVVPVTSALLALLGSNQQLDVLDRCVNALMDVYAEDGVWSVEVVQLGVLEAMQRAVVGIERLVKGQRLDREDRRRYVESVGNVREFLRYKPQHI